jgi:Na+/proline symporter
VQASSEASALEALETRWSQLQAEKRSSVDRYLAARETSEATGEKEAMRAATKASGDLRKEAAALVKKALPGAETRDSDYIFITFVKRWLPSGLFGLLIAVILAAAMSSIASELTALGATTSVDFYRRVVRRDATDRQMLIASQLFTVLWGLVAIGFAGLASLIDNLIQAVNLLGSLFYGTILGLFVVAFFLKRVQGHAVFLAALISQGFVLWLHATQDIGYLWYNAIGCGLVVFWGLVLQQLFRQQPRPA